MDWMTRSSRGATRCHFSQNEEPKGCLKGVIFKHFLRLTQKHRFLKTTLPSVPRRFNEKAIQKSHLCASACHWKTRHIQKPNRLPPPLTPLLGTRWDVVPRRAEGVIFKGNLKALAQYPDHLGQAFRLGAHEAGILAQNSLLALLLKGGSIGDIAVHQDPSQDAMQLKGLALRDFVESSGDTCFVNTATLT